MQKQKVIRPLDYSDRKNSNSDLHSRLKTRKVLGVGEIADDRKNVYRSKISQILGHSDHLWMKLPVGLHFWCILNVVYFAGYGLTCLIFPGFASWLDGIAITETQSTRLHGCLLIGYAVLYNHLISTGQRSCVCLSLKSAVLLFILQIAVRLIETLFTKHVIFQVALCSGNAAFHYIINPSKLFTWNFLQSLLTSIGVNSDARDTTSDSNLQNAPVFELPRTKSQNHLAEGQTDENSQARPKLD